MHNEELNAVTRNRAMLINMTNKSGPTQPNMETKTTKTVWILHVTKRHGWMHTSPASCMEGPRLTPWNRLALMAMVFVIFLSPSKKTSVQYVILGHEHFLPYPLQFTVHCPLITDHLNVWYCYTATVLLTAFLTHCWYSA